jgi:hypothetical protein
MKGFVIADDSQLRMEMDQLDQDQLVQDQEEPMKQSLLLSTPSSGSLADMPSPFQERPRHFTEGKFLLPKNLEMPNEETHRIGVAKKNIEHQPGTSGIPTANTGSSYQELDFIKYNMDTDISYIPLESAEDAAAAYRQRQMDRMP